MGYRLYCRTRSLISYEGGWFNWQSEEVEKFFQSYCPSLYVSENEDAWEIDRQEFHNMLKTLQKLAKDNPNQPIEGLDCTVSDCVDILQKIYDLTKNKNNYSCPDIIYLDWI